MCRKSIFLLSTLFILANALSAAVYEAPPKAGDPVVEAGTFIDLADGQRLQLFIEDQLIVAFFIDKDGLVMESPAESILFIVDDPGHKDDEWRTVLDLVDTVKLTSPRRLYGPYNFRGRVIIRFTEGEPSSFPNVPIDLEKNLTSAS
jgi:hypothetical protein